MDYKFTVNDFEGPMDLLLHLIKKSDLDIFNISIEEITKQYLDYISAMEEMNLNIASEYLIMAAELLEIKSSVLLPKNNIETDEFEEDPKEQLINRLLDYKRYKEITSEFKNLEEERKQIYTKIPDNLREYKDDNEIDLGDIKLEDLMNAFSKFLSRKELEKPLSTKITTREFSINERSDQIRSLLKSRKKVEFRELFEVVTKDYIVVTFLAILSLAKKQELEIKQEDNFDEIYLSLRGEI